MPTILVFIPFSRHIFRQMLAGVHRFYGGAAKVQIVEGCANAARLRHLLEFWRPKGCIVEASEGIGIFTRRNLGGVPTVYLDRASLKTPEFDVVQDYATGSEAAARELISPAMAHYAFVGYHIATTWSHERCKAFKEAVKLNGLPFSSFERVLPEGNRTQALREWIAALPKPCGILAANDTVAEEVLAVCTNLNLHVPEDVMIVGVDNDEQICEQSDPTISSVCPDFELRPDHQQRLPRLRAERTPLRGAAGRAHPQPAHPPPTPDVRNRRPHPARVERPRAEVELPRDGGGAGRPHARVRGTARGGRGGHDGVFDAPGRDALPRGDGQDHPGGDRRHPDGARRGSPQGRRHAHRRHRPGVRLRHGGRAAHRVQEALRPVDARLARQQIDTFKNLLTPT